MGIDLNGSVAAFELFGQRYFICNDQALPGSSMYFRNSVLSYVRYRNNGEIDPVRITTIGVGQYDGKAGIAATDFFKADSAEVKEDQDGRFQVIGLRNGSRLLYPKVRNLRQRQHLTISGTVVHPNGVEIEIRRGSSAGAVLGNISVRPHSGTESSGSGLLKGTSDVEDLCLTIHGGSGDLIRLSRLAFS